MQTYEQQLNDIHQAAIYANFSAKKEEMILNDKPLFSKNAIDTVVQRWAMYCVLSFLAGMFFAYLICHL